ncbi:hypothetical protein GH733_008558 [Mirounga leonina]|nr:hypothetical protein GH733_008558 [Mirounga leonina]
MLNFCAAPSRKRKSTQLDLAFFRLPRDPARCQNRHRKRMKELSEDEIRTLKQKKIDETSEQEPKYKEINNSNAQNPSAEEGGEEQDEDILPLTLEEKENKEYLKSLFEILILIKTSGWA